MTDLSELLRGAEGDGVHWSLEGSDDLNVNLVHLDPGHAIGEHVNDAVDVLVVVLGGQGSLTVAGENRALTTHVVAHVPRGTARTIRAADGHGLDYLTIHRRRAPLGIGSTRDRGRLADTGPTDEGGDPACWAHLFDEGADHPY